MVKMCMNAGTKWYEEHRKVWQLNALQLKKTQAE